MKLPWTKDKKTSLRRRPTSSQSRSSYSYYQSRDTDKKTDTKRNSNLRERLKHVPTYIAGFVIVTALLYSSVLTTSPKVVVVNKEDEQVASLLRSNEEYKNLVKDVLQDSIFSRSKLTIDTASLESQLYDILPEATDLSVTLPILGRNPIVYMRVAKPVLLLSTQDKRHFIIDEQGRAVAERMSAKSSLITVDDKSGLTVTEGSFVLTEREVEFMAKTVEMLNKGNIGIKQLQLPLSANEFYVYPKNANYYIKFSFEREGRAQVGAFLATKQQLAKDGVTPTSYIDVRVDGRTFTK